MSVSSLNAEVNLVTCQVNDSLLMDIVCDAHKVRGGGISALHGVPDVVLGVLNQGRGVVVVIIGVKIPDDGVVSESQHSCLAGGTTANIRGACRWGNDR